MELNNNIGLDDTIFEDSFEPDVDDFTLTCNSGGKVPLYHSMRPCIKETSKYESHISEDLKACIDRTLNYLLEAVVINASTELIND